jgi:hypothetical protein
MTPWVGNLVSNYLTNVFVTPAKTSTLHNNKITLDNQTCNHVSNNPYKSMKIKQNLTNWKKIIKQAKRESFKNLPLRWFFTSDSTTTNINLVTNVSIIVSKSQCTAHMCWPFTSNAKWWSPKLYQVSTSCGCFHVYIQARTWIPKRYLWWNWNFVPNTCYTNHVD